jgi:DNA transposition AAA+ family ATPase
MNSDSVPTFIDTRQHQRFVEFCYACRVGRFIGVCTGRSGVGKTRSAQTLANWEIIAPLIKEPRHRNVPPPNLEECCTAIYTPDVSCTVKRVESALALLRNRFDTLVQESICWHNPHEWYENQQWRYLELLIVDKAQRLSQKCLDTVCDFSEKHKLGIVLMGMPGFDYRIRNYEQINNRVGFYHVFSTPRTDELRAILEMRWQSQQVVIEDGAV